MNFTDFEKLVNEKEIANPVWFGLDPDSPANENSIALAQKELNAIFPDEYIQFIKRYGGGYFALGVVFSLDPSSDFNLVEINKRESHSRSSYILCSENGSGDFYGFKVINGKCLSEIYFLDHETGEWEKTKYENLLNFLSEIALSNQ
ncbi:hypothetical protein PSCICJ_21990 [Pseudomonas cichorii]|uniref:SMI1/KNR4 family protein n=1 Tax=Pseudomonas cichorii TaxID=36746 RepID=UPI001910ECCC|nr:SMI1/KNR4 family protein [Pseudomonas cichorii]GFM66081.1 hypothetical protein PSCICJ_21990 [Pseudomonas cichorii]